MTSENQPNTAQESSTKVQSPGSLWTPLKLISITGAIALLTPALYFLGFIYYAGFAERLRIHFHGISLPIQEYLIVSWQTVVYVILFTGALLLIIFFINDVIACFAKRSPKKCRTTSEPSSNTILLWLAISILVGSGFLFGGAKQMLDEGYKDADKTRARKQEVIIYAKENQKLQGRFVYLRNFGKVLLVYEMNPEFTAAIGYRFLQDTGYTSYTVLPPVDPPKEESKNNCCNCGKQN